MGTFRDATAAAARAFADVLKKPAFSGTPFPSGTVEQPEQLTQEQGGSGTFNFGGFIRGEDFNPEMDGQTAIKNLDEMRRGDSQVHAALEVVKLPIRTADYELDPSDPDDPQAEEIAEFVQWCLFEGMTTTWDDLIRQALLMLDFGFMLFEKVWTLAEDGPYKDRVILAKLAPRPPRTIWQWFTDEDGALISIKQLAVKAGTYQFLDIPAEKLVRFTFQQEGDNFTGISMLRSAYPHWLIKKNLYLIDAIRATRFGVGIPRAKLKPGYKPTVEDREALALMLQGMSSHQHAYLIEPEQVDVDILMPQGVQGGAQLLPSIEHQNQQITRNILAQFLDMGGKASGGSRALGASAMDFFLNAIESIAEQICDVLNKQLIKELVDMNFTVSKYPTLRPVGIQETDVKSLATAAQALAAAGLLTPDKKTENTFRNLLNLPEVAEDAQAQGDLSALQPGQPPPPQAPSGPPAGPPQASAPPAAKPATAQPAPAATTATAPAPAATVALPQPAVASTTVPPGTNTPATKAPNAMRAEMEEPYQEPPARTYGAEELETPEPAATLGLSPVDDAQQPSDPRFQPPQKPELKTVPGGTAARPKIEPEDGAPQVAPVPHDPRDQTQLARSTWQGPSMAKTPVSTDIPARTTAYATSPAQTSVQTAQPAVSAVREPTNAIDVTRGIPPHAHMARSTVSSSGDADEEGHSSTGLGAVAARQLSEAPPAAGRAMTGTSTWTPASATMRHTPRTVALASRKKSDPAMGQYWRDPTPLETKVLGLREIPHRLDTDRNALLATLRAVREEQILRIASAVAHADRADKLRPPLVGKAAAEIVKTMRSVYQFSQTQLISEMQKQGFQHARAFAMAEDPFMLLLKADHIADLYETAENTESLMENLHTALDALNDIANSNGAGSDSGSWLVKINELYLRMDLLNRLTPDIQKATVQEIKSEVDTLTQNVRASLSSTLNNAPKEDFMRLEASAELSAQSIADKLLASARQEALRLERAGWDQNEIEDALKINMGQLSDADITRVASSEVNEAFSMGRTAAVSSFKDQIEKAVYSAILDNNVCDVCEELDGEEFQVDSDEYEENMPPNPSCKGGDQCRCTYIYVLDSDAVEAADKAIARRFADWNEDEHPRGEHGKFAPGQGHEFERKDKPSDEKLQHDSKEFDRLKTEWARTNNDLLMHLDHPESDEAKADNEKLKGIVKDMYKLDADPGGVEGIGKPGGARDLVVVGAGPGGMAAAIMGGTDGLDTLLIEANAEPGGQARYSSRIENYPGFPVGVSGAQLASNMYDQTQRVGADTRLGVRVEGMTYDEQTGLKTLSLSNGEKIDARSVVIAGGLEFRKLDFPGNDANNIFYGDSQKLMEMGAGKPVVVIGGSNGAAQAALGAARTASDVYVISRSNIDKEMSDYQVQALKSNDKIHIIERDEIASVEKDSNNTPTAVDTKGGKSVPCAAVGIFAGSAPNMAWMPDSVARADGKITVNGDMETSMPGVFAAGDLSHGGIGRVGAAVGAGQIAERGVFQYFNRVKASAAKAKP